MLEGFKRLAYYTSHIALVVLIRTENIEKFESCHFVNEAVGQNPEIEKVFRISIHVKSLQVKDRTMEIVKAESAVPIGSGRRGVKKWNIFCRGPCR